MIKLNYPAAVYHKPYSTGRREEAYAFILSFLFSGVDPATIRGSKTGVFVGAQQSESSNFWPRSAGGYVLPGNAMAMFANRISFAFDFKGQLILRSSSEV